mgnify:CR=1 FL=1
MNQLSEALRRFAGHRTIVIASDFDGTLADHGPDLGAAIPVPGAEQALNELAQRPNVTVMLISGRRLADLLPRFDALVGEIITVGEHGAEWPGTAREAHPYVDLLASGLAEIAAGIEGALVERKLSGVTMRHRRVEQARVEQLLHEAAGFLRETTMDLDPTPRIEFGRGVIDVSLVSTTKGDAVESVRNSKGAAAVLYFGDDVSDESVFEVMRASDVGVKVGVAQSSAAYRVEKPRTVVGVLEELLSLRQ